MSDGRFWTLTDAQPANKIADVGVAAGFDCAALVDDEQGGCIAFGSPQRIMAIAAVLNAVSETPADALDAMNVLESARVAALGIDESGDEPEFDGPSCERCGIEPAATCECDEHLWNGAFCSRCGADEASGFAALPCRPEGD